MPKGRAKIQKIIVIGGGHAGCEAALAAARLGFATTLFAISLDSIAMMPCNPCIGGASKGHLVREIDALGGQMGKIIDAAFIQSRMLNRSKGPAVYSLRAQADKNLYARLMKKTLEATENLTLRQAEVVEILTEKGRVTGVRTEHNRTFFCDALIFAGGTYLKARCLSGDTIIESGAGGLRAAQRLSANLEQLGLNLMRFKTGTPPRVHRAAIDFSKTTVQPGDVPVVPFSFETAPETVQKPQVPCHLTYTNERTHEIIRQNLHRSPMYAGVIEGTGARYCPSIEDKIARFADKDRHPVFIEPEGSDTDEMYLQGLSTSLPEDVQEELLATIPGLERCKLVRGGYAIEYDCIDPQQLRLSLETKRIKNFFCAGQINGTSGYEEAAAQGLVAGINAALALRGEPPLIIDRAAGYIGVLIDELVTKGTSEPYRMMTSRAEYRLLLRQDNADLRLTEKGFNIGLISRARYENFLAKKQWLENETARLQNIVIPPSARANAILAAHNSAAISTGAKLTDLIKRPELNYAALAELFPPAPLTDEPWQDAALEQVNIQIKYEGYIRMQIAEVEAFRKLERQPIPPGIDYTALKGLRIEARQKLDALRPVSIGQASRISGVSPADISVLLVYIKATSKNPREL